MQTIKHLFHIESSVESVFESLTDISKLKQWYTNKISGDAGENGEVIFHFGEMNLTSHVTNFVQNKTVSWKTTEASIPIVGHVITFHLDRNNDKTRVRFEHKGFENLDDSFANMNYSWAKYLESLRQLCQKGVGEAFGSKNYRS
tara:strand:+ start:2736 stop:3167 length:432 start_codon:yes stop_codon:yes gene_type:complete